MKGVDQRIDGGKAVLFSKLGELGVPYGGVRVGMAQKGLDMTQAQATFQRRWVAKLWQREWMETFF